MSHLLPELRQTKSVLLALQHLFEGVGIETAALDARLLIQHVCGIDHGEFIARTETELTAEQISALEKAAKRRLSREPVSRIVGEAEFWSLPFYLSEDTLDPRPDTETLIELVLEQLGERRGDKLRLLDLGTGTGCIVLSLLHELPLANGVGVDLSPGAVQTATRNAKRLDDFSACEWLEETNGSALMKPSKRLSDRAEFVEGDWFSPVSGQFDIIVSNPPYIARDEIKDLSPEVSVFDPLAALDGGVSGLEPYEIIFQQAGDFISDGGLLVLEFGIGQEVDIINLLETSALYERVSEVTLKKDLSGIFRCICARF